MALGEFLVISQSRKLYIRIFHILLLIQNINDRPALASVLLWLHVVYINIRILSSWSIGILISLLLREDFIQQC